MDFMLMWVDFAAVKASTLRLSPTGAALELGVLWVSAQTWALE